MCLIVASKSENPRKPFNNQVENKIVKTHLFSSESCEARVLFPLFVPVFLVERALCVFGRIIAPCHGFSAEEGPPSMIGTVFAPFGSR